MENDLNNSRHYFINIFSQPSAVEPQENLVDCDNITVFMESVGVQTDRKWIKDSAIQEKIHSKILKENRALQNTVQQLRIKLNASEVSTRYTVTALETDDRKCKYITGISSGVVLRQLYEAVKQDLPPYDEQYLEKIVILALRKIRLNEPFYTLSLIYDMHHSTVADKIFQVIHCIYPFMSGLVRWPSRDVIKQHMPDSFKKKYGDRVTIIIDCFEVPIESPRSEEMIANANVYSFYKHHKTVKVLAGITPAGAIAFVSEAFGGRTSDQQVTRISGFLDLIEEGDFVLADRGFLITEMLAQKKAELNIPAFKKTNQQLEPLDACHSRDLAALRIHVERLIGSMRQKCLMLSNIIPITLLERWNGGVPVLDQIIKIAAAIVNLCPSVVTH